MKKITYYFSMIFMAVMMLSLTSCDEDADIAYALHGSWKGYMQTQLGYQGRYYLSNRSEVTFNSGYDSGDGYWIDYYSNAPWDYVANRITWRVSGTTIYINFLDTQEKAVIRDYSLDDNGYFYGDIDFNSTNRWISFQFVKVDTPNWNKYYWYDTDEWYDSWGYYSNYAKTRADNREEQKGTIEQEDNILLPKRFFPENK